jgi:hypothetical protein
LQNVIKVAGQAGTRALRLDQRDGGPGQANPLGFERLADGLTGGDGDSAFAIVSVAAPNCLADGCVEDENRLIIVH